MSMNVFIIAATSLDGFIAEKTNQSSMDWTSAEDKKFFRERTKQARAIVMGSTTYKTIGHPLPGRLNIIYSKNPSLHPESEQLRITQLPPTQLIKKLEAEGYTELAVCGGAEIYALFLRAGVVNKIYVTLEPIVFGQGVPLFPEGVSAKLQLVEQKKLSEQTLLLEYDVQK